MGKFFDTRRASGITAASLVSLALVAVVVYGATTISTSINTGGTLDVTGASTLTGTVTMSGAATVGTTLTVSGNSTFDTSTFYVDATNNRVGVLTITPNTAFEVVGAASSTSLRVGGYDAANGLISGMVFGTCNLTAAALTASTTANFPCTGATGLRGTEKVFVTATSTLVSGGVYGTTRALISAASTTIAGQINVDVVNMVGANITVSGTLNFWAVR